jgi:hypothetical protein
MMLALNMLPTQPQKYAWEAIIIAIKSERMKLSAQVFAIKMRINMDAGSVEGLIGIVSIRLVLNMLLNKECVNTDMT